jgi:hypothetical protein
MTQVEQRFVPPAHRPMNGPSNTEAAQVEAERVARGPLRGPRTASQLERDIAARQQRLVENTGQLREVLDPRAVAQRTADKARTKVREAVDGHEKQIIGAVVGVVVVIVVWRVVRS